ncbi:uncharacterized protein [Macrobrachium rosenbergii]|uniref:uncharacterized protein n=1 Tax=Macrobrachium rosenbergii TaxID=79674 RepID=UPI0034D3E0DB
MAKSIVLLLLVCSAVYVNSAPAGADEDLRTGIVFNQLAIAELVKQQKNFEDVRNQIASMSSSLVSSQSFVLGFLESVSTRMETAAGSITTHLQGSKQLMESLAAIVLMTQEHQHNLTVEMRKAVQKTSQTSEEHMAVLQKLLLDTNSRLGSLEASVRSLQIPVQNPAQIPVQNPIQFPVQNPIQFPVQNPVQIPVQDPVQIPVQDPVQIPVQNPVQFPVQNPVHIPVQIPPQNPVQIPSASNQTQEEIPEVDTDLSESFCPPHFFTSGTECFYVVERKLTWEEARKECQNLRLISGQVEGKVEEKVEEGEDEQDIEIIPAVSSFRWKRHSGGPRQVTDLAEPGDFSKLVERLQQFAGTAGDNFWIGGLREDSTWKWLSQSQIPATSWLRGYPRSRDRVVLMRRRSPYLSSRTGRQRNPAICELIKRRTP